MKIGIITDPLNKNLTGIGKYTQKITKKIPKINPKNQYYSINYTSTNLPEDFSQIKIRNLLQDKILETYSWYPYLTIKLRKIDLDIVHNTNQAPTFFKFSQKNIITVHDLTPYLFPKEHKTGKRLIFELLFGRTLKNSNKIIAVSKNTKKDILKKFPGIKPEKIKVIYEAANENYKLIKNRKKLKFIRKKYSLPRRFVLFTGTIEPRKNITTLFEAFSKVYKKTKTPLVIVGKKGWKYEKIYKTYKKLNLEDKIIFTGYVPEEDLIGLYNLANLFVYPSIYEGFGLPPLEAMACGTPVITSNTSSLPEVVGDAGIKVDPYDIDELANAIERVLGSDTLQRKMKKKGLERAKKFSWEKTAEETVNVYKEVIKD